MDYSTSFLKRFLSLIYQLFKLITHYLWLFVKKFWKVIVFIVVGVISIITLKKFRKKGGNIECE